MKKSFLPYEAAKLKVSAIGLKSAKEWQRYSKKHSTPGIPSDPRRIYKEWEGYPKWMGYEFDKHKHALNACKKYKVNEEFFRHWSSNMAYVLGFWFTDGNILRCRFSITQKDKRILCQVAKEMGSNRPLSKRKKKGKTICYNLVINSEPIVKDIIKLGGKERKSLDVPFPKIPKEFMPAFIRGVFDGDGSIGFYYPNGVGRLMSVFCGGSKNFMLELFKALKQIPNLNGFFSTVNYLRGKNHHTIYRIGLSHNDTIRLCQYMYDANCDLKLERKYAIFKRHNHMVNIHKGFASYDEAKKLVDTFHLKTRAQWMAFIKAGKKPYQIPSCPHIVYQNSGWKGWGEWLRGDSRRWFSSKEEHLQVPSNNLTCKGLPRTASK